jgi:hypothetical protein
VNRAGFHRAVFISGGGRNYTSAYVNDSDGSQAAVRSVEPRMRYDTSTRFIRRGELHLVMDSGDERIIEVEALREPGFFLETAGCGSWNGHIHGSWKGPIQFDGEHIGDCWVEDHLGLLGQPRDTTIGVREGDAVGYGIMESIVTGEWPELGLGAGSERRVSHS